MDVLTTSNLKDTLQLKEKLEENWNKMNRTASGLVRSCLIQDIEYHVLYETSARKLWEILEKKYLTESINAITTEQEALLLSVKERTLIDEHMNNHTKLLTYLVNINVAIEEEDKALILLNSLPDEEYETFILTLINDK